MLIRSPRHEQHRRCVVIGSAAGPAGVVAAVEAVLINDCTDGRSELRVGEPVDDWVEDDGRLCQESRDGGGERRQVELLFAFAERPELSDEADDGVGRPGREAEKGQREDDEGRAYVRLPAPLAEGHGRLAERGRAVAGHDESRHLAGGADDESENGRVAESEDGDGEDEAEDEEVNVVEAVGQVARRVVPRARHQHSFRLVRRPAKQPRRSHQRSAVDPDSNTNLHKMKCWF